MLYNILKAADDNPEARQAFEYALASRCPGRSVLTLTTD
jgi:hypothetical protein